MFRALTCCLFAVLLAGPSAWAQDEIPVRINAQNRTGDLPFSSSIGTGTEKVDLATGNLSVSIPILLVPGRGMDYSFALRYDANIFVTAERVCCTPTLNYQIWNIEARNWVSSLGTGWQTLRSGQYGVSSGRSKMVCDPFGGTAFFRLFYTFYDATGGKHPLMLKSSDPTCSFPDLSGPDLGGDGMWASSPSGNQMADLKLADGTIAKTNTTGVGTLLTEPNGNYFDAATGLDTLGRTVLTQQSGTNQALYLVNDANGNQQTYTVNFTNLNLATSFNVIGLNGYPIREYAGTRSFISSIVLPNGTSYQFQYDPNYGSLTRIDLPTGGYITYTWQKFLANARTYRYVASRTENVGGQASTWTFARTGTTSSTTVTVTDPLGNQSVYIVEFGKITSAKFYAGVATGTPLRQVDLTYVSNADPLAGLRLVDDDPVEVGLRLTRIKTTLENGLVSQKEFDYETFTYPAYDCYDITGGCPTTPTTYTSSRGNVTEVREYDWGTGAPGGLLRKTTKTYLHNANSAYLAANIVSKVLNESVYDGAGSKKAETQYVYDDTALTATSGAPQHDYTNYSTANTTRGNATKVKKWRNTDSAYLAATYVYDDLGNIRTITDPGGHSTTWGYTDAWANTACPPPANSLAYVTSVANALGQSLTLTRNSCTGQVAAKTDANGQTTSFTYDFLNRPDVTTFPDGGQTDVDYDPNLTYVLSKTLRAAGTYVYGYQRQDTLGRTWRTELCEDGTSACATSIKTDTTFDPLGRASTVTNPYRATGDPTYGVTTNTYDALGRTVKIIPPDGTAGANNISTAFSGNCTTVTDQAGKTRKSCTDGLGRLIQVFEPNAAGSLVNETDYQYDVLGNLLRVDQKGNDANSANWRTRTFTYNSLSQLLSASNPESGTINYAYDTEGNVLSKDSPAPNQTNPAVRQLVAYCYDALHRLRGKKYASTIDCNTPATWNIQYLYDQTSYNGLTITYGIGRRTGMADASGSTAWSYDQTGHALTERRTINGVTKNIGSTYWLNGSLKSLTYPSGRVVNFAYDAAARPLSAIDSTNAVNFATNAQYAPHGGLSSLVNGSVSGGFAGFTVTNTYNKRLQPVTLSAAAPSQTVLSLSYDFGLNTADNGNVLAVVNNRDNTRSVTYTYDRLNRIASAQTTSSALWGNTYTIDPWGNLLQKTVTKGTAESLNVTVGADNRLNSAGYAYDAAGNLTQDGSATYTYDAENRITTTGGVTYAYDGDGVRVKKSGGSAQPTLYWGESFTVGPVLETDLGGTSTAEYVFFNGRRVARVDLPGGSVHYYFADHLGSASVVAGATGTIESESDYYPYGGERVVTAGSGNHFKFTGKERDTESGLDYFGARYYKGTMGRWLSPDWAERPVPVPYAQFKDSQTLNLYSYVRNNSINLTDANGHGFWKKLKNALTDGGWNEDSEAKKERERREKQRQIAREKWEKQHPNQSYVWHLINLHLSIQPVPIGMAGEVGAGAEGIVEGTAAAEEVAEGTAAASAVESVAVNANKLNHIFGKAAHNLSGLVSKFGSEEAAFNAIQQATETAVKQQGLKGVFQTVVQVGGEAITVRGNVVDGAVKIGTAYK